MKGRFFTLICLFWDVLSVVVFPFKTIEANKIRDENDDNFVNSLLDNKIFSNIKIGTPEQDIDLFYSSSDYSFYITNDQCFWVNTYKPKESSSYKLEVEFIMNFKDKYSKAGQGADTITVYNDIFLNESKKIEGFNYILTEDIASNQKNSCGYIGLALSGGKESSYNNLFEQLISFKIIESPTWTIKYAEENSGQFIIGGIPHEYDASYKQEQYQVANSYINSGEGVWMINFNKVLSGVFNMQKTICKFTIENNLFIGSEEYQELIEEQFLGAYMDKGICSKVRKDYDYYVCESSIRTDKELFPKLKFFNSEFNYTFVFNFNDLFQELENGKLLFNVVFSDKMKDNFILGKIFMKKYQLIFNTESKTIGFYNKDIELNVKTSVVSIIIHIIIIIVAIIVLFFLFMFIKKMYRHHKLKGNALRITSEFFNRQQQEDLIARAVEEEQRKYNQNLELRTK